MIDNYFPRIICHRIFYYVHEYHYFNNFIPFVFRYFLTYLYLLIFPVLCMVAGSFGTFFSIVFFPCVICFVNRNNDDYGDENFCEIIGRNLCNFLS